MCAEQELVVDLLGALAYHELTAFAHRAQGCQLAVALADKTALGGMAVAHFGHHQQLFRQLTSLGVDPAVAMAPFVPLIDEFHLSTAPSDWLEGVVKGYVGEGIGADFYREVANLLDPPTTELVGEVLADTGYASFALRTVRTTVAADPACAGRIALWARRLAGEVLGQARHMTERDTFGRLVVGDGLRIDVGRMLEPVTAAHEQRMVRLGLAS